MNNNVNDINENYIPEEIVMCEKCPIVDYCDVTQYGDKGCQFCNNKE